MARRVESAIEGDGAYFAAEVDVVTGRMALHGELDIATASLLDDASQMLIGHGPSSTTICLADLDFIDAAGLDVLVTLRDRLGSAGRLLALTNAQCRVARVFDCTGLGHMLASGSGHAG